MKVSGNEEGVSLLDGVTDFLHVLVGRDTSVVHLAPGAIDGADRPPRGGWCARTMCGLVWRRGADVVDEAAMVLEQSGAVCGYCDAVAVSWTARTATIPS